MEKNFETVMNSLGQEKEIFVNVERLTEQLIYADPEELPELVEKRGRLIEQAAGLRKQAADACGADERMRNAVVLAELGERTDARTKAIYDASLAVCAVWNRVQLCAQTAAERLSLEAGALRDKIELLNADSGQVAGRYFQSVRTGLSDRPLDARIKKYI